MSLYSGPGKVFFLTKGFQADGENGPINIALQEPTTKRGTATFGHQLETLDNQMAEITFKPFDNWGLLPTLFPTYLGVSTAAGSNKGLLAIGSRPHDVAAGSANGNAACKIWTPDGRLYNFVRGAIIAPPSMKFGNGQGLFDQAKIAAIGDVTKNPGDTAFLIAGNAITETGASDPGGAMVLSDFANGVWGGAWGTYAGFGGDAGAAMQAEDFWQLSTEIKFSPLTVQKVLRHYKLDSVRYMIKARLTGPTHTQILGKILAHTAGQTLGAADLTLSGPSSRSVILQNAEIVGAGFEFGGTKLGTGEVGFVSKLGFNTNTVPSGTAGVPDPILIFSS